MPKDINLVGDIPKLYKRNAISLLLFGYIKGVRATLHTITISKAIDMFIEDFGLSDDKVNRESLKTTYNRMQIDLKNLKRSDNENLC